MIKQLSLIHQLLSKLKNIYSMLLIQTEENWLLCQGNTKKEQIEEPSSMGSRSIEQKGHLAIEGL